jgi:alkylation response protein AidB-like acyl-CoA dehydrogenase
MVPPKSKLSVCCIVLAIAFLPGIVAAEPKHNGRQKLGVRPRIEVTEALSELQDLQTKNQDAFVIQSDLDELIAPGGGGACCSANSINLLQTLRKMLGLEHLSNPHKAVLKSFVDQKELLRGRVTNEQLVRLIHFYERYLDGAKVCITIESAPNSTHSTTDRGWKELSGPNLTVKPREVKIVSFTWTDAHSKVLGRHFVLLKEFGRNEIVVVDPRRPLSDNRYVLEYRQNSKGECTEVFLLNPVGTPVRTDIFEINTIFTVSILDEKASSPERCKKAVSMWQIKEGILQTANELKGKEEFTSPRVWREKTAGFGLPGLDLPVDLGGSNWSAVEMIEVFRHAGSFNLNFRDVVGGGHVRALCKFRTPEIEKIIQQVASGKGYVAIAITEPEAGTDIPAIKSKSEKVEGGYRLTGVKRFNARLEQATHVIIFTNGTSGEHGKLSVFVLPINTPGLTIEHLSAHGLTGNSFGGLRFENLFVPESHLVGKDGDGLRVFFEHFLYWRLMQATAAIGTGENALQQMADRIKNRQAFGGPIGRFTHLQQPIGQYVTELEMAYALAEKAAAVIDNGDYHGARAAICGLKAEGVEIALCAVDAATRAFGGEGYSHLVDLGDRLRDLNGLRIADGTTDVMRMDVVRQKYGEEFWKMAIETND